VAGQQQIAPPLMPPVAAVGGPQREVANARVSPGSHPSRAMRCLCSNQGSSGQGKSSSTPTRESAGPPATGPSAGPQSAHTGSSSRPQQVPPAARPAGAAAAAGSRRRGPSPSPDVSRGSAAVPPPGGGERHTEGTKHRVSGAVAAGKGPEEAATGTARPAPNPARTPPPAGSQRC